MAHFSKKIRTIWAGRPFPQDAFPAVAAYPAVLSLSKIRLALLQLMSSFWANSRAVMTSRPLSRALAIFVKVPTPMPVSWAICFY